MAQLTEAGPRKWLVEQGRESNSERSSRTTPRATQHVVHTCGQRRNHASQVRILKPLAPHENRQRRSPDQDQVFGKAQPLAASPELVCRLTIVAQNNRSLRDTSMVCLASAHAEDRIASIVQRARLRHPHLDYDCHITCQAINNHGIKQRVPDLEGGMESPQTMRGQSSN
jgi:hypothetical protein